jgi:UDP-2-acetamido-3-amino-2,3-dideoxy-glucuronate N-acetyltransferase
VYKHSIKINNQIPNLEKGEVEYVEIEHSEPLKRECQHFVDVVNSNKTPLTNGNEGLRVLNVLTAATLSANMKILEQK